MFANGLSILGGGEFILPYPSGVECAEFDILPLMGLMLHLSRYCFGVHSDMCNWDLGILLLLSSSLLYLFD